MKILIAVALAALVTYANAACSDIMNCNTCSNPGPKCKDCPDGYILTTNREQCKTCGTGCDECTIDSQDEVTCTECSTSYYLKDGACTYCGDGCDVCHEDVDGNIDCDECHETDYTRKVPDTGPATCESCPSKCKTCSMESDGTTVKCNSCWDYKDENEKGYFLQKSDSTCKACPTYCEKCADDGEGKGICSSCYDDYVLLSDSTQESLVDGEKCLKCPSDCTECSGEMYSSTTAKCTACKADEGLYLSDDQCITCGTGCKSCDTDGLCTECEEDYRLDEGSCTSCPAFCVTCSYNDETSENECSLCDEKYGPKDEDFRTCDSCGFANCGTCTRSSSGTFTCNNCKSGYIMNSAKTQCVKCPDGCDVCEYDDTLNGGSARCTTCSTGYTSNVDSYEGTCGECPSDCDTCLFLDDGTGNYTNPINCTACTDTDAFHIGSYDYPAVCVGNRANCLKGHNFEEDKCENYADCEAGYQSDQECQACLDNCKTCNNGKDLDPVQCDTCMDGYVKDSDNSNTACLQCGVSNCKDCNFADYETKCQECEAGYEKTSDKESCIKCPSNCVDCSVSGTTSSCTNCVEYDADAGTKEYVKDGDGGCKSCGNKCIDCDWDSTNSQPICKDCEPGYEVNGNDECEEYPANCDSGYYDTTDGIMACNSNGCETGYGRKTDKMCYECPNYCDSCSLGNADEVGDDVLICDSNGCKDGYAKNDDVCAKCPSNCAVCQDNSGTMECTECMDGYDLYSADKTCQKCPTNCEDCSAGSTVTCNECKDGYALAADKASCIDCATAAFDNCKECTNIDGSGSANCTECDSGFTLQDEEEHLACVDASALDCILQENIFDNGPECSDCAETFTLEDYICIQQCYACGDVDEGVYVDQSECMIPSGNATENDATLVSCPSGICYGALKDGKIVAGCLPEDDPTGTCVGDRASGEFCSQTESDSLCERCCSGEKCNTYLQELDGLSDSAVSIAANIAMLLFAAVMAALRF